MAYRRLLAVRNAALDTEYDAYNSGVLEIYTGAQPATGDTAPTGTLLASIALPAGAFAAAASGSKVKAGTWTVAAAAAGVAGYYRIRNTGSTRSEYGTVTATSGGGDMELDNTNIAVSQAVTVNTFSRTAAA